MQGAEAALRTAEAAGVRVCFANPGTTEMPFVAALDAVPGIRAVLGLFEGVCTGAADGWARMSGEPALTLLHLGPGFANGIANLHNARRARTPVVNLVGDQTTWHLSADAPLTSDIVSLARPVSGHVIETRSAKSLPGDLAQAVAESLRPPGQVATLIVPGDCQWEPSDGPAKPVAVAARSAVGQEEVDAAARALRAGDAALLLGGAALGERALRAAGHIAGATGCRLICETFWSRLERGGNLPVVERLPYFPEQALASLEGLRQLVLVGARSPVSFFGYPGVPSSLVPEGCQVHTLAHVEDDVDAALEAVRDELGAARSLGGAHPTPPRPPAESDPLDANHMGRLVASKLPEHAIVMDEAATSGLPFFVHGGGAPRHTHLALTGGAIGQGLPCALGAALACPERKVIAFQADGSGAYTVQALWTMARESADVCIVLCNNRSYRILRVELARAGVAEPGPQAIALTDLGRPDLDWVGIAGGFGVPGERLTDLAGLGRALHVALAEPGPRLVEVMLTA